MTDQDIFPDLGKHLEDQTVAQSNKKDHPSKFPSDDSNTGDHPIYPDEDDLVPVNDIESGIENEVESDQEEEIVIDQHLPVEPDTDEPPKHNPPVPTR